MCRLRVSDKYETNVDDNNNILLAFTDNTVLSAIYIEPPADVRSVPQNYTIHCITTGQTSSNITVGMFLERHGQDYYIGNVPPVLGYSQDPPLLNTLNSTTLTYDYSEEVVWRADRVEVDRAQNSMNKDSLSTMLIMTGLVVSATLPVDMMTCKHTSEVRLCCKI